MSNTRRVLWGEGMLLTPQHFQQSDRHREALDLDRSRTFHPLDWGIRGIAIDPEALHGGELRLLSCTGALPDGALFDVPTRDRTPDGRSFVELFDASRERLGVYVGMPLVREGVHQTADEGAAATELAPFVAQSTVVADAGHSGGERQIRTAAANLKILFDGERLDDYQFLRIAEVLRTDTGGYTLDEQFLPPMTQMHVAPWLMQALRGMIDMLAAKSEELAGQQRKTGGMAEASGFWLLHTVNTHLPRLTHYYRQERVHPETLYLALAELAAQLCTFARGESPRSLPEYLHGDLRATFGAMIERLRALLGTVVPTKCIPIPLERVGETMFQATVHDAALFASAEFYLGVAADMEEVQIVADFPHKAKISSNDKVQQLLMMAMSGLSLRHVPSPPQDIPVQPGRVYFQLEKAGEHWEAICSSQSITLHLPPNFVGLRLELMAVKA